jgi:hypothetical protein
MERPRIFAHRVARCRARHIAPVLSSLAVFTATATAHAQGVDEFGAYGARRENRGESPQHVALEIRIGRYVPSVDSEFNGATPYQTMFGDDNRYSIGLEVDWQAMRIPYVGTLGPGFSFGYTKATASAFLTRQFPERSQEDTALRIFPMYAVAVLRADYIARNTPVPLVPYAKLGVGAALWSISNGGGTAYVGSLAGSGLSYGPQFALGGMLLLDAFDRDAAMEMDQDTGVNNAYFFLEWYVSELGIGANQMHVGTNTWVLGLALEI